MWRSNSTLYRRIDKRNTVTTGDDYVDTFSYDVLERLTQQATSVGASRTLTFAYSATGNLTRKTSNVSSDLNVTGYTYSGPHRLTSATISGVSNTLSYDNNGNITQYAAASGPNTWLTYDARNNVTQIHVGPNESTIVARDQFWYDTDDQRVQSLESWDESGTTRTRRVLYLGGDYEYTIAPGTGSHDRIVRLQITATVRAMRQRRTSDGVWEDWFYEFVHRDHLGSVDAITNSAGAVQQKTSFDPFGGRRATTWNADLSATGLNALRSWQDSRGSRGFTDHEHLNRTGFIHMNGRVYDPRIGRFVSPDPIVQAPWFSQSYNRYAYVFNSPLSFTDPSGFAAGGGGTGEFPNFSPGGGAIYIEADPLPEININLDRILADLDQRLAELNQRITAALRERHGEWPPVVAPPFDTTLPPPTVVIDVPDFTRAVIDNSATTCERPGCLGSYEILQDWVFGGVSKDDLRSAQAGPLIVMGAAVVVPVMGGAVGGVAVRVAGAAAARSTSVGAKIEGQLARRGWSRSSVDDAISNPTRTVATRDTRHLPGGGRNNDPATAYYSRDGGYVVRNDRTGDIVQVSNRNDPNWRAPWD